MAIDLYMTENVTVILETYIEKDSPLHKGVEMEVTYSNHCSENFTENQGRIRSSYSSYEETTMRDCYILLTAPVGFTISAFLSTTPSYLEGSYFEVFDGNLTTASKLLTVNTDYVDPRMVFSTGRFLFLHNKNSSSGYVTLDLNYMVTGKGRGCGGKMQNVLGVLSSPLYPEIYKQ